LQSDKIGDLSKSPSKFYFVHCIPFLKIEKTSQDFVILMKDVANRDQLIIDH